MAPPMKEARTWRWAVVIAFLLLFPIVFHPRWVPILSAATFGLLLCLLLPRKRDGKQPLLLGVSRRPHAAAERRELIPGFWPIAQRRVPTGNTLHSRPSNAEPAEQFFQEINGDWY